MWKKYRRQSELGGLKIRGCRYGGAVDCDIGAAPVSLNGIGALIIQAASCLGCNQSDKQESHLHD